MSQLQIRQRVVSFRPTYDIYDSNGQAKYFVKAAFMEGPYRTRLFDKATGRELGYIRENVFRLLREYEIYIGGNYMGKIKKQFEIGYPRYNIDYKGWRLEGDYMRWNYNIYEGARLVVSIEKKLLAWGDTYILDFENDMDELPALMVAIAIDSARETETNQRNTLF